MSDKEFVTFEEVVEEWMELKGMTRRNARRFLLKAARNNELKLINKRTGLPLTPQQINTIDWSEN